MIHSPVILKACGKLPTSAVLKGSILQSGPMAMSMLDFIMMDLNKLVKEEPVYQ